MWAVFHETVMPRSLPSDEVGSTMFGQYLVSWESRMSRVRGYYGYGAAFLFLVGLLLAAWMAAAESWRTNFEVRSSEMDEIMSGGRLRTAFPQSMIRCSNHWQQ